MFINLSQKIKIRFINHLLLSVLNSRIGKNWHFEILINKKLRRYFKIPPQYYRLVVAAATENDNDSKDDNPSAVVIKDVAQAVVIHYVCLQGVS